MFIFKILNKVLFKILNINIKMIGIFEYGGLAQYPFI
jgi:hypothetical protein